MHNIYRFLDTVGDGSGTHQVTGNYAAEAQIFKIQAASNQVLAIKRMIVLVEDAGTFDSGSYGNAITLTNGLILRHVNDEGTVLTLTPDPIKTNPHWAKYCYDTAISAYGSGNEHLAVRWTFTRGSGAIILNGEKNGRIELVANDDFSGLVAHTFMMEGL